MRNPSWSIAEAIKHEAMLGGYSKLALAIARANQRPSDSNVPRAIDRRKLKAIAEGKDFTISTRELMAIDRFFGPKGKGFADNPLFARHTLTECMAENLDFTALIAAYQRNQEERNDVSLWDVLAFREVLADMQKFRSAIRENLEPVSFFDPAGKHSHDATLITKLLSKPKHTICCIGSPRTNVGSEFLLADAFGIRPFANAREVVPFKFFWPEDLERKKAGYTSAFEASIEELIRLDPSLHRIAGRVKSLIVGKHVYLVEPKRNTTWEDYGIIVAQRLSGDRIRVALAGLTGPSTNACAQVCRTAIETALPPLPKGKGAVTRWAIVKATVSPGHPGVGDTRLVQSVDLIGEPSSWPLTKHEPVPKADSSMVNEITSFER